MKFFILVYLLTVNLIALSIEDTKHLLNRTSFGFYDSDLVHYKDLSRVQAIDFLINKSKTTHYINNFKDIEEQSLRPIGFKNLDAEEKRKYRKFMKSLIYDMKANWYSMMINTKYSFQEKMTLFWHNHFVSEFKVVKNPYFMHKQNILLRRNSLGKFDVMLRSIAKDNAMLIYLNNNLNKKDAPNENFSRELMELFTLGIGNYTEKDVRQSAKAFTGWRINKKTQRFKKVKKHHDFSKKEFLNQTGNYDGEDIVRIILEQDQTSIFITSKLYEEFIGNTNNKELIHKISKKFKDSDYDISIALKEILISDEFWDNKNYIIKSPIEFSISLIKRLNINTNKDTIKLLIKTNKKLDQILYDPPSVQGWLSNKNWINSSSLVNRMDFIKRLIRLNYKDSKYKEKLYLINKYSDFNFQLK